MRVLLITWNFPPKVGGMEIMLKQLSLHLSSHMEIDVFGPYADLQERSTDEHNIIRPSRQGLAWFFLAAFCTGFRRLRRQHYDVVLGGSALVLPIVYLLGRLFRPSVVCQVYGLDLIYTHPMYKLMIKLLLPRCDGIAAISHESQHIAIRLGADAGKTCVINPGLDFAEFLNESDRSAFRKEYDLENKFIILSAGRLARRKGIPEFVQHALPQIVEAIPQVIFLVVGENPSLSLAHKEDNKGRIVNAVRDVGMDEHVRLLGYVDRHVLINLYFVCDLFILPAIRISGDMEGFGIVLTEASAAGKPVISTKLGGISDAVVDGKSGILVESEAWQDMAAQVIGLLNDEERRHQLGAYGRQRVREDLDWPAVGKKYAGWLQTIV